jgi:RNA polymerase sigma factor (sigma-70 family)
MAPGPAQIWRVPDVHERARTYGRHVPNHPSRIERLVRAAARKDPQAWDELVKEFSPVLRGVARRFRLGSHQVEDVVQATWERLFARITTIEDPAALPGWLVTTAQREAIRAVRASGRELPFDELPVGESADASSTADRVIVNERRAALRAAVGRLPGRHRTVADAILAETALGYAGIAHELGMPLGSIGPMRARCIARLRRDPVLLRAMA